MTTEFVIGLAVLVAVAGIVWWQKTARLGRELFGSDTKVRYVQRRWVIEGSRNGWRVRYSTGGMGLFPALTYLLVEADVSKEMSITDDEPMQSTPSEVKLHIDALRRKDGFKRLDVMASESPSIATIGRVSWLHPGRGVLLRRFTRDGGDAAFIKNDLAALIAIANACR